MNYLITLISFLLKPKKRKLIILSYKFRSKIGLEIGGPSAIFSLRGYFPIYLFATQVDTVNFSSDTIWEGKISEGKTFNYFGLKYGYQYIREAADIKGLGDKRYDFILSSHSLEHIANPIKALKNWYNLLKPFGKLVLVLPDKKNTSDLKRPYTTFKHLLSDYNSNVDEDDTTHFDEIANLHFYSQEEIPESPEVLRQKLNANFHNRMAHHHVFDFDTITELLNYCGFEVLYRQEVAPFHLVTIAQKRLV